jgi:hypothetical protein
MFQRFPVDIDAKALHPALLIARGRIILWRGLPHSAAKPDPKHPAQKKGVQFSTPGENKFVALKQAQKRSA